MTVPVLTLVVVLTLGACADAGPGGDARSGDADRRELRVFAAASLRPVFTVFEAAYERRHREVDVLITYGASSSLARQIADGAPAEIFVAADEQSMRPLVDAGLVRRPVLVATNRLALLVERGNPKGIRTMGDLGRDGIVLVLCSPVVPCGRLAAAWLDTAGVDVEPVSQEANASAVVSKVSLGEADVGIAYVTDAAAKGVERAPVPQDELAGRPELEARYLAASVDGAAGDGADWLALLRSAEGRAAFAAAGFGTP